MERGRAMDRSVSFWVATLAAVAVAGLWLPADARGAAAVGQITRVEGMALVRHQGEVVASQARVREGLLQGDAVATGERSSVEVLLQESAVVTLGGNSRLELLPPDVRTGFRRARVGLLSGKGRVVIPGTFLSPGEAFQVQTPTAIAVTGEADVVIEVVHPGLTRLVVLSGHVAVRSAIEGVGQPVGLGPGEMTEVAEGQAPALATPTPQELRARLSRDLRIGEVRPVPVAHQGPSVFDRLASRAGTEPIPTGPPAAPAVGPVPLAPSPTVLGTIRNEVISTTSLPSTLLLRTLVRP